MRYFISRDENALSIADTAKQIVQIGSPLVVYTMAKSAEKKEELEWLGRALVLFQVIEMLSRSEELNQSALLKRLDQWAFPVPREDDLEAYHAGVNNGEALFLEYRNKDPNNIIDLFVSKLMKK